MIKPTHQLGYKLKHKEIAVTIKKCYLFSPPKRLYMSSLINGNTFSYK